MITRFTFGDIARMPLLRRVLAVLLFVGVSLPVQGQVVPPTTIDSNQDGTADAIAFVVGTAGSPGLIGQLSLVSGTDSSVLWARNGLEAGDGYGPLAVLVSDADGDGVSDILASAPRATDGAGATMFGLGRLELISGADGSIIWTDVAGDARVYGIDLAPVADQDGDGVSDALVETAFDMGGGVIDVRTILMSGADGQWIIEYERSLAEMVAIADSDPMLLLAGDRNQDGMVDQFDMVAMTDAYNSGDLAIGDVNGDGVIDAADFNIVLQQIGQSAGGAILDPALHQLSLFTWNSLFPSAGANSTTGGVGCHQVFDGLGTTCSVTITECPEQILPVGAQVIIEAQGLPTGGTYQWSQWSLDGGAINMINGANGPVMEFETVSQGVVTVEVTYRVGDCVACARCTFYVSDCSVSIINCGGPAGGTIGAIGIPAGGDYSWTITEGLGLVESFEQRGDGLYVVVNGTPGQIEVEVEYTVNGCTTTDTCQFGVAMPGDDSDGDGLPDHMDPCPLVADCDGDGFSDRCEVLLGSDPQLLTSVPNPATDRDNDGLSDVMEICSELLVGGAWTNHLAFDTDGDGVQDLGEIEYYLHPLLTDTDGDGTGDLAEFRSQGGDKDEDLIYDDYEREMGWDPTVADEDVDGVLDGMRASQGLPPFADPGGGSSSAPGTPPSKGGVGSPKGQQAYRDLRQGMIDDICDDHPLDSDNDGLCDIMEIALGTNPHWYDSDGDGLPDGMEFLLGLDPLKTDSDGDGIPDTDEDFDGDGLTNHEELFYGTDPGLSDTDGDGVWDYDEIRQGSNPLDPEDTATRHESEIARTLVTIGDPSYSESEHWAIQIGPGSVRAPGIGEVTNPPIAVLLRRGEEYEIRVRHLGGSGDLDYVATVSPDGCDYIVDEHEILGEHENLDAPPQEAAVLYLPALVLDQSELQILSETGRPAVFVGAGDVDGDGVPDYADGFVRSGGDVVLGETPEPGDLQFTKLTYKAGGLPDDQWDGATVSFAYPLSDPFDAIAMQHPSDPWWYDFSKDETGNLRLWRKAGNEERDLRSVLDGGDLIPTDEDIPLAFLDPDGDRTFDLYLEAVARSDSDAGTDIHNTLSGSGGYSCTTTTTVVAYELEVIDLRAWDPIVYQPQDPDLSAVELAGINYDEDHPSHLVGGAITDGVSACIVRLLPESALLSPVQVRARVAKDAFEDRPEVVGGFVQDILAGSGSIVHGSVSLPKPSASGLMAVADIDRRVAVYVPPEGYTDTAYVPSGFSGPTLGFGESTTLDFELTLGVTRLGASRFILRRPPILLIHGLDSSASTWVKAGYDPAVSSPAALWDDSAEVPIPTRLYKLDYESENAKGYDVNYGKVGTIIELMITDYRNAWDGPSSEHHPWTGFQGIKYAATRVDVVGHSMGGQLTRLYISDVSNSPSSTTMQQRQRKHGGPLMDFGMRADRDAAGVFPDPNKRPYLRKDNYGAGDIRRFIPMGSPFDGSPLATAALGVRQANNSNKGRTRAGRDAKVAMTAILPGFVLKTSEAAVNDLEPGSMMQLILERGIYPRGVKAVRWAPMVGIAVPPGGASQQSVTRWTRAVVLLVGHKLIATEFVTQGNSQLLSQFMQSSQWPSESDLVVPATSQRNLVSIDARLFYLFHSHFNVPPPAGLEGVGQTSSVRMGYSAPPWNYSFDGGGSEAERLTISELLSLGSNPSEMETTGLN